MRQQATCGCRRRSRIRFLRSIFLRSRGGGGGCRRCCCRMVCHLRPKTILCCSSLPVEVYKALEEERNGKTLLAPVHLPHHTYRTHLFTHGLVCNCCSQFLRGGETTTAKASSWLKAGRLLCMDRVGTTWVSPFSFFLRTQAQRTLLLLLRPSAQLLVPPPPLLPFAFSLSALPRDLLLLFPFLRWLGFAQASGLEKTLSFLSPSSSLDGASSPSAHAPQSWRRKRRRSRQHRLRLLPTLLTTPSCWFRPLLRRERYAHDALSFCLETVGKHEITLSLFSTYLFDSFSGGGASSQ